MPELKIDNDALAEMVSAKLADDIVATHDIHQMVKDRVAEAVSEALGKKVDEAVDDALSSELDRLLHTEVIPVDIWGERTGEPTTIAAALQKRAAGYWDVKVDKDGKPNSNYGGKPRHEWLFNKIVGAELSTAIAQNSTNIIAAFKDALKASQTEQISKHIDDLIRVKSHGDKRR